MKTNRNNNDRHDHDSVSQIDFDEYTLTLFPS